MSAASSSHNIVPRNDDVSVQGDVTKSVTDTVQPAPQRIAVSSSLSASRSRLSHKYDPSKSWAPLVIDRTRKRSHSRSPSQITIRANPSEAPTQHPDMLAMLQELDLELANQNQMQGSPYPEEALLEELDTLTVYYAEAAAPPNALESLGNVNSSTSLAYPAEGCYSLPCEPHITGLTIGAPVVQRPSEPNVSPLPIVSPPSRTISFLSFFKSSRSNMVSVPQTRSGCRSIPNASSPVLEPLPSGIIPVFKRSHPNTMPVSQANTGCHPRRLRFLA